MSLYESIKNNVNEFDNMLEPRYDARKSFYGKAKVNNDDNGYTLVSYTTPILTVKDGKIKLLCGESALSQTTMRHVREFLQQMAEDGHIEIPDKITRQWLLSQVSIKEAEGYSNDDVANKLLKIYNAKRKNMNQVINIIDDNDLDIDIKAIIDKEAPSGPPQASWAYYSWVDDVILDVLDIVDKSKSDAIRNEYAQKEQADSDKAKNIVLDVLKKNVPSDAKFYYAMGNNSNRKNYKNIDDFAEHISRNVRSMANIENRDEVVNALNELLGEPFDYWKIKTKDGNFIKEIKESEDRQGKIISFSKHLKDMASEMESVAEMYDEDMLNDEDDVFGGTEDSYAMEMLDQHISEIFLNDPVFSKLDDATLTNVISDIINNIVEGKGITFESLLMTLKKYDALKQWSISIGEGETFTFPKEIVDKVNAEYEANKPEIIEDIKEEYYYFRKQLKREDLEYPGIAAMDKAYKDAIKDPEDIWCECGAPRGEEYKENGDSYLGVDKDGYICNNCKKYVQIG